MYNKRTLVGCFESFTEVHNRSLCNAKIQAVLLNNDRQNKYADHLTAAEAS
jgi:hypothetical protein